MLNKKAQGMSTSTIILLILGIVILVILILGFTLGWDKIAPWMQEKQQFSITKEVCPNETFIEDVPIPLHLLCAYQNAEDFDCMKKLMDACERFGGELWKDKDFSFTGYCIMKDVEQRKEVCFLQEVEEVEYNKNETICAVWTDRSNVSDYEYLHYGIPCLRQENVTEVIKILKKNITTEWLDENCDKYTIECSVKNPMIGLYDKSGKQVTCDKFKEEGYKCFDKYTVEVLQ